jgi:hypothetical protein
MHVFHYTVPASEPNAGLELSTSPDCNLFAFILYLPSDQRKISGRISILQFVLHDLNTKQLKPRSLEMMRTGPSKVALMALISEKSMHFGMTTDFGDNC